MVEQRRPWTVYVFTAWFTVTGIWSLLDANRGFVWRVVLSAIGLVLAWCIWNGSPGCVRKPGSLSQGDQSPP